MTYELQTEMYIYPLGSNTRKNEDKYTKKEDLNTPFINQDLQPQFIFTHTLTGVEGIS